MTPKQVLAMQGRETASAPTTTIASPAAVAIRNGLA